MGATEELARLIVESGYDSLPAQAIEVAKQVVLDGVANMLAGCKEHLGTIVTGYVREAGGSPVASVVGGGFKTSLTNAAFANGVFGHALDYEVMWYPPTHPTSPTLPAILALSEAKGLSGRDVITSLVLAFEVQGRLRLASAKADLRGFHPPGVLGVMGSAAAGAKLLGLDVDRTRIALGIAASRAGGVSANTGTMTKSTHCGNAARMGLEAALLAKDGFTANEDVLETRNGYAQVLFGPGFDLKAVTRDFGKPYRMVEPGIAIKKYPSQFTTHRAIEAMLELRSKHSIRAEDVEWVEVEGPVFELTHRPKPRTGLEGKFSVHYTTAAALLDGKVAIDTFTDEKRFSPKMVETLNKVRVKMRDDIPADFDRMWSAVQVRMKDGREFTARCDKPRGIWGIPLSREERLAKFQDCASRVLSPGATTRCVELVEALEALPHVKELTDIIRG